MAEPPPVLSTGSNGKLVPGLVTPVDCDRAKWIHIASILAPITAPLFGFFAGTNSPFIRAHSLEAALDLIRWKMILFAVRVYMLFSAVLRIADLLANQTPIDWETIIKRAVLGLIVLGCFEVWNILQAIGASRRASKGIWPRRNFLHRMFKVKFPER